ncbi:Dodecaprenyl-phosphate galacturonate synthase [bacterium HR36]|nr:Dodecaprenyl-phosphate galacturonate synthase [bacterium HR36]
MISVVIPVYNEQASLAALAEELMAVAVKQGWDMEFIFVDDGSTDGSWETIRQLAEQDARIYGIRFRRNFGKAAALAAGFRVARGDLICTIDADLQDDPSEIPRLFEELHQGYDLVTGWKKVRHDPWHKVIPSRIFNWLVSKWTGVYLHDHNCGLKLGRQEVFREIRLYGELHRFITVLAAARGFRVTEVAINHRPRPYGHSKYGASRFIKGFLDLLTVQFLTRYGRRPQHLLGTIGMVLSLFGLVGMGYLTVLWVLTQFLGYPYAPLHTRPLLIYSVAAVLLGAQMMSIGFLAELITAYQSREEDAYSIAETTQPSRWHK